MLGRHRPSRVLPAASGSHGSSIMQTALVTKPCGLRSGVQRSSASRPARVQAVRVQAVKAEQKVRGGRPGAAGCPLDPAPTTHGGVLQHLAPLHRTPAACQVTMRVAPGPMAPPPPPR